MKSLASDTYARTEQAKNNASEIIQIPRSPSLPCVYSYPNLISRGSYSSSFGASLTFVTTCFTADVLPAGLGP
jgi:hypothetical protein